MRPPMFFGSTNSIVAPVASVVTFWVVFYLWIGVELWLGARRRSLPAGATDHDSGSKWWLVGSVVAIGFWIGFLLPGTAITSGRTAIFTSGLVLMVAGMALRWYSIRVLGTSFTREVSTRPGQQVVQSGPYRWARHPSYTGELLTVLGVLVCCCNLASLASLIVVIAGYAYRIRSKRERWRRSSVPPIAPTCDGPSG